MSYQDYLQLHNELSADVAKREQEREAAAAAYDRVSTEFNEKFATASFAEKDELLDKLEAANEAFMKAEKELMAAKAELEKLELDNPALEDQRLEEARNAPSPSDEPERSFKEKAAVVIERSMDVVAVAGSLLDVTHAALNPDLPRMPSEPPAIEKHAPVDIDKALGDLAPDPRDTRDKTRENMEAVQAVNDAYANAPSRSPPETKPEPQKAPEGMTISVQGSASFGTPEWGTYMLPPPPPPPPPPEPEQTLTK